MFCKACIQKACIPAAFAVSLAWALLGMLLYEIAVLLYIPLLENLQLVKPDAFGCILIQRMWTACLTLLWRCAFRTGTGREETR